MNLSGITIAVGVTGGIAAFKACSVVSSLKKLGADVFVVMTKNAQEFITPLTFETLSGNRVITDTFDRNFEHEVGHISLAKKAGLSLIAPATANIIGKIANGIADDYLSTTVMAAECPLVLAPAMNTAMLNSAAYQENIKKLTVRGAKVVPSVCGRLACGDTGDGRMAEPEQIVEFVLSILKPMQDFSGKTVLITAGGTSEPIDPVRSITNRSSGKMGIELCNASLKRGANVILIAGNIKEGLKTPPGTVFVKTTDEMYSAVMSNLDNADIIIKAAAPSDYKVKSPAKEKIKSGDLTIELVKNVDIAAAAGKVKGNKKLVVFAAETEKLIENAKLKLASKNADMVVANDITKEGAGFDSDTNIAALVTANAFLQLPKMTKAALADAILDKIKEL